MSHNAERDSIAALAAELRDSASQLALAVVDEAIDAEAIPSLARLAPAGRIGQLPAFVEAVAAELADPDPSRVERGSPLAVLVRDHAREREELGFAPQDVVTEFSLLRRVLSQAVSQRADTLPPDVLLTVERRLNDAIDGLVREGVIAYFDRVTSELAYQVQRDSLTGLLNHQAFTRQLEIEIERGRRYDHGLVLISFDIDRFKRINDTHGHPEGDRVLRELAAVLRATLRAADLAGRMGGDEFAVGLVESEPSASQPFLARIEALLAGARAQRRLPEGFSLSAGAAQWPREATSLAELVKRADERLYEAKRAKGS